MNSSTENAKPCPFCGHKTTFAESEPAAIRKWFWYCPNCAAHGPNVYAHHRSAEECKRHALRYWNTRAEVCAMTDNRTIELLPCKKCGGEAEIVSAKLVNEAFSDASCVARCRACWNRTDRWYSDEDAAESWNRKNGNE